MKVCLLFAACMLLMGAVPTVCFALDKSDYAIFAQEKPQDFDAMIDALSKADVVFFGEEHDHKLGHAMELEILKALYARNSNLGFSLEMFERDTQLVLDEYLTDQITETQFLASARPWPNYKTDYRPLIEFCKEKKLPVVAANAPRRYVNIVSRKGQQALQALPKTSKSYLPPLPISMEIPDAYAKQLDALFSGAHNQGAPGTAPPPGMPSPENMKEAQALWDATMAKSVRDFHRRNSRRHILQINGSMHSDYGYGIVDRLKKSSPGLKILLVTMRPEESFPSLPAGKYAGIADFIILSRPEPAK